MQTPCRKRDDRGLCCPNIREICDKIFVKLRSVIFRVILLTDHYRQTDRQNRRVLLNLLGGGKKSMDGMADNERQRSMVGNQTSCDNSEFCRFAVYMYLFYRQTRIASKYGLDSIKRLFYGIFRQWPSCL